MSVEVQRRTKTRSGKAVLALCFFSIVAEGYDMVAYGTSLPSMLADPSLGLTAVTAGLIGSYVLVGMLVGSVGMGLIADFVGRRKLVIASTIWFSAWMVVCALTPDITVFGFARFMVGIGVGALIPTAAALAVEFAPKGRGNTYSAIMWVGYLCKDRFPTVEPLKEITLWKSPASSFAYQQTKTPHDRRLAPPRAAAAAGHDVDFIENGADDERTLRDNKAAFDGWALRQRVVRDSGSFDLSTTVAGEVLDLPVLFAPIGLCGAAHWHGKLGAARAADQMGTRSVLSTGGTRVDHDVSKGAIRPPVSDHLQVARWTMMG